MLAQLQDNLGSNAALRNVMLALLAVGVGIIGGLAVIAGNPIIPFVALAALIALPWLVTRPMFDLFMVAATICLLPYATMPVRLAVLTPTLLEIMLLFLYVAWMLRLMVGSGEKLVHTPVDTWLLIFVGWTIFTFGLGIWRDPSNEVMHNYFKLLLAVGLFFAVVNLLRRAEHVQMMLRALITLGGITAVAGLVLWRLPDQIAGSLLLRLSVIGYPTDRVIRYVNDDPAQGERAVSTQVDPNSFGGMLVIIAAITGVALLARKPVLPRWLLGILLLAEVAALVVTQSRTALLALFAAAVFVALVRYRRLWAWGVAGAVVLVILLQVGVGRSYLDRLVVGLQFADQANQMRLAEYQNALAIISRYPAFGVGFGTAGELDLTTGASSVYLTIAERTGLPGLLLFLVVLGVFFAAVLPFILSWQKRAPPPGAEGERDWSVLDTALLGGTAAVLGESVVGIADHYYFNIEFPHMVAIFWLAMALALAARRLLIQGEGSQAE